MKKVCVAVVPGDMKYCKGNVMFWAAPLYADTAITAPAVVFLNSAIVTLLLSAGTTVTTASIFNLLVLDRGTISTVRHCVPPAVVGALVGIIVVVVPEVVFRLLTACT